MAIMLPGWATQAMQTVGYKWPSTNEDTLLEWGHEWAGLTQRANGHLCVIGDAVAHVGRTNTGPATDAFTAHMNGAESNLTALQHFSTASQVLGQACSIGAGIIVALKFAIIGQLAAMVTAIFSAATTGGASTAVLLAVREATRRLIQAAINIAVSHITGA